MPLLPRLLLLVSAVLGLALPSAQAEKPKFATADAAKAFEAYHKTKLEKAELQKARAKLKQDPRLETIKLTRVELLDLRKQVRDTTLSEDEREEFFRKFQMKAHELRSLQRDTVQHLEEQSKVIDEEMVRKTKDLLAFVHATIAEVAEEQGFAFVFETGGKTSSQIPTLIYIRDAVDITDVVIERLNKDAPKDDEVVTTGETTPG